MRNIFNKERPNILFWDDEAQSEKELLFTEITLGLETYGWTPHIFTDKEKAQKVALGDHIDAVVLDLMEKGKPVGLDMLRYLREKRPYLPIVMFTIYSENEWVQSAMKVDSSYYLTMPIRSYHDVIRAIEVSVERERLKERLIQDQYFASVGKLAAGVAHFIKNSLWNIRSRSQYLIEKTDKQHESYKLLETIDKRCEDAFKVVTNLLNFAKREPKKENKKKINIIDIIEEVLNLVSFECNSLNISIRDNIFFREENIKGDEFELKEAFLNIIKNAIEAMPDGGELSVDYSSKEGNIIIKISDTGMGMSKETLKDIFMPYYTTKDTSMGFGLFDTRRIIHNHNGTIKMDSKEGKGTVVTLTFPKMAYK